MTITVTVNDREVVDLLDRLLAHTGDLTPAFTDIGQEFESRIRWRFQTQTDPLGDPWDDWAESTRKSYPFAGSQAAKKIGQAGNARVLDRFGDMLGSLNWEADSASVRIGFGEPYAAYHEFGTRNMTHRRMLFAEPNTGTLADDDKQYVLDVIERFLLSEK